ncbi:MAG TPA: diguanylate cyclase, partial [Plasticicumulans sp.]|nr:diguanylate cyclase [Plasticicumulans sp.]
MPLEAAPVRPVHGSACEDTVTDSGQGNTAQGQAAMQEQRLRQIVDQATDTFIVIDAAGCIADVNAHGCQNLGYAREQLIGRPYALLDPLQPPARLAELTTALATGPLTIETHHRRSDGSELPVEVRFGALATGDGPCLLAICRDISERRALEAQLRFQSTHDLLTGLPNRNLLEDRLNMAVAHARRRSRLVGVLCLDLIRFKQLVDTLGHTATDELLRQIARRLIGVVRPGDTVSRQAGDTFVIVLNELVAEERASQIAGRLREAVTTPLTVAGQEVYPDASIGIAVFPRDGSDCDTLLRHAAAAMQRARQHPRNEPQFYAAAMNTWATERLGLEGKLRRALDGRELLLHYQPQIELSTGHIVGTEALLRWRHPELGMVSPAEFIPLAEETGLILPIGDWVLRTACAQARAWRDAGLPELRMCVNLSALQFAQPDLAERVAAVLAETGLPATALELEITESV